MLISKRILARNDISQPILQVYGLIYGQQLLCILLYTCRSLIDMRNLPRLCCTEFPKHIETLIFLKNVRLRKHSSSHCLVLIYSAGAAAPIVKQF